MDNIISVGNRCTGCAACVAVCPQKAIALGQDKYGFYYPVVDETLCNGCGLCRRKCHACREDVENLIHDFKDGQKYCARSIDEIVRRRSSSGGIFTHIAQAVPEAVVIGAAYVGEDNILRHTTEALSRLRRSKYAESCREDTERLIREARMAGKPVIFCGTPCQTASVRMLHPDATGIVLVDFICHGVPSMQFLNDHMAYLEKKKGKHVEEANFRSKTAGWSKQGILYYYDDGTKEFFSHVTDSYMFGFYKNLTLRSSCYTCSYAYQSCADITLGDFWGVYKYDPKLNDEKGLSLVITHTRKGEELFAKLTDAIISQPLKNEDVAYIFCDHEYADGHVHRDKFLERYEKYGFDKAMDKYFKCAYQKAKLREKLKGLLR